jgi:uncharacterized phage protein gp47/JayE
MAFGVNDTGFQLKRLRDILDDLQPALNAIADPDTGELLDIDLDSVDDPVSQIVNAFADSLAQGWEMLQVVYNQFDPALATGAALRGLVQLNGITAQPATFSTAAILLTGNVGTIIPAGQQISDAQQNTKWTTQEAVTIPGGGSIASQAIAQESGPVSALAGTLATILTPVAGWTAVTNTADAQLGQAAEDIEVLRRRRDRSTETPSVAPVEAIYGALADLDGVQFVRVYVNNTLVTNGDGIPAKSIAAVVQGGTDQDIAETLFLRSPAGVDFFGAATFILTDLQGFQYEIRWIRPTLIDIFVQVDIEVTNLSTWPTDGADQIKAAIVAYAQQGASALGIDEGFNNEAQAPGVDVNRSRLYTPINSVPGHRVTDLLVGLTMGGVAAADIPIAFDELADFDTTRITVNVT